MAGYFLYKFQVPRITARKIQLYHSTAIDQVLNDQA